MTANGRDALVVGVDFGTLSGRALVVRVSDGAELGSAVHTYSHGVVDEVLPFTGARLRPDWALQVPGDYVDVLKNAVPAAIEAAGVDPADVIGIGTDFTACTMVPTTDDGTPLCELPHFADRPHANVKLWKHHAAQGQADRINALATKRGEFWLARYGGLISSEWEFAKGLQVLEEDPEVYAAIDHWVEGADWIVWQLTGRYTRNACTAGYKGIRQDGKYPSREFLAELNPDFADFVTDKVEWPIIDLGDRAGSLTARAAEWTGLPEGIAVSAGNVDAHVTNPAGQAIQPGQMVAIMGTSTCHTMNSDQLHEVPGMCGVVDGGITKGLWGYEAGQSGVGDIFGWFVHNSVPESYAAEARSRHISVHELLTEKAMIIGETLATKPEDIYRALVEATAFGTRTIVEAFSEAGVPVREFIVAGGLIKNALLMQIYADVLNMPLSVVSSEQAPALGSAIHAAVAAGAYPDVAAAAAVIGRAEKDVYQPIKDNVAAYDELFEEYHVLHHYFGRGENKVMHHLRDLRRRARSGE